MLEVLKSVTPNAEQWQIIIEGTRNPMNSWDRMDSKFYKNGKVALGPNDLKLLKGLAHGGRVDAKYRRMIPVWATVNAPLYWWKEYETYKIGAVSTDPVTNSCSTMHKIADKPFEWEDFSTEHLSCIDIGGSCHMSPVQNLKKTINMLEEVRQLYLQTHDKRYWWQMIQSLPSNYNQTRTCYMNYQVLSDIVASRSGHKLDEWKTFIDWIDTLPYSKELIRKPEDDYAKD